MELRPYHKGVVAHFRDFDEVELTIRAADNQAGLVKGLTVGVVEFKAVAVALHDGLRIAICPRGARAGGEMAEVGAESHCAALGADALLVFHDVDHGPGGLHVKLGGVGAGKADDVSRELNHHDLHTQAEAKIWDALLTGVSGGTDHALNATAAKAAGDDDAMHTLQQLLPAGFFKLFRGDPFDVNADADLQAGVCERLLNGKVGIAQFNVFADDGDGEGRLGFIEPSDEIAPIIELGLRFGVFRELHPVEEIDAKASLFKEERHTVNGVHRGEGDDGFHLNVTEQGDLVDCFLRYFNLAAGDDDVRTDTGAAAKLTDGVLGGFGLELAGGVEVREIGDVDEYGIGTPNFIANLSDGFKERLAFYVADGAADFDDDDLRVGLVGDLPHTVLDGVGDVGNDLDCAAQEVATPLPCEDG